MLKVNVYTANCSCPLAPRDAFGKYFISLGSENHNYGKCFELVCWIDRLTNEVDIPYLSLIYKFEFNHCTIVDTIYVHDAINILKKAIKLFSIENTYRFHRDYMLRSSQRCLESMLIEYSLYRLQHKMASKIQRKWLYHYYTPTSEVCKRIKLREFECLNRELMCR